MRLEEAVRTRGPFLGLLQMSPNWPSSEDGKRSPGNLVKLDRRLMNDKVSFRNNMDNMLLRTEYKIFYAHPGGRQHSRQNLGDYWVCAPVLTEGARAGQEGQGATRGHQGAVGAEHTQRRSGSVTGLRGVLCSLNFKSNEVKLQQIRSRNEPRLQRSFKLFNL